MCEGAITRSGRIWADGKELNQSDFTIRSYRGSEDQQPDSLIEAKEGAGNAPAYRGTAYVVFERMPLARFGNRLPQLNFEVFRTVDSFEETVKGITIIPASGEFVYESQEIVRDAGGGATITENVHSAQGGTDWKVALTQLQDSFPNVATASLFVSWFGDDLRAGQCQLRPGVEILNKVTLPKTWGVGGTNRANAHLISTHDGRPAFGGTPSDGSVVSAIQDLSARGLSVTFTPFVMMDVPQGNTLNDPYTGAPNQPVYPWRGRITVDPAPGQAGTPDKTAAAATQVSNLVGTAQPGDFSVNGQSVSYSGPAEWSFRRMVLHYAHLCQAAGGVDAFVIGSELRGLTQVRDGAATYPFVDALVALASDVKSILGSGTKVTYAADWSEYFGHQPADGSGDVYFNLDPLWSSADIDAIAIDVYWPLSDWRDGSAHADKIAGAPSIYDFNYLKGNIFGGEGYDWYYASAADRDAQIRTPITDGAYGKPWVFRFKDIRSWWQNQHFNRPGGVEAGTPTAWAPESKPLWFTEFGCPAIDKGSNQPNVFFDPKSSESQRPYFSRVTRDDLIQRRYIQSFYDFFDPSHQDYAAGSNPASSVYSGEMVDIARLYVYTWDARPYPAFPLALDVWADGGNWEFGHWLTGRAASGPVPAVVSQILNDFGFSRFSAAQLTGHLDGYVIDRIMSAREALQSLELSFFFDSYESGGLIQFKHRGAGGTVAGLTADDLVDRGTKRELYQVTRGQETELPLSAKLTYIDGNTQYRQAAVEARRLAVRSERISTANVPIVMAQAQAQAMAESWLQEAWTARQRASFVLPPSRMALEPTDLVTLQVENQTLPLRIIEMREGADKELEARSIEPEVFTPLRTPLRNAPQATPAVFGQALAAFLDLPLLRGDEVPHTGYVAAYQSPWPGAVAFYRSPEDSGFIVKALATGLATLGVTEQDFSTGPTSRFDRANICRVRLDNGELQSVTELALLGGANTAAIENADGDWEVFQFRDAALVGPSIYELSNLLRGQAGTEKAMADPVAAGARFVLLDSAVTQVDMTADEIRLDFNWKYGPISRDIGHPSYQNKVHGFSGLGLRPLSPVHVRGARAGNDVQISWVRRTRIGGDSWDTSEVPLGEDVESYQVEILDGAQVKRTLTSTGPSVSYSEAEQIADWGAPQFTYNINVYQLSASYGRGQRREAQINV
ncbi:MAG: glycoside hydrolase/phage tail family protein [Proteobacteria bacterium]|nr:glycoside hydrolase/phage tail family protein [Pseudomonadota bacterium]